jgi:hypothetical protein
MTDPGIGTRGESIDLVTALDLLGKAEARVAELEAVEEAGRLLYEFLENERETFEPPSALQDQGYAALETAADYDKLENLSLALGDALAAVRQEKP